MGDCGDNCSCDSGGCQQPAASPSKEKIAQLKRLIMKAESTIMRYLADHAGHTNERMCRCQLCHDAIAVREKLLCLSSEIDLIMGNNTNVIWH